MRRAVLALAGPFFVAAGLLHFLRPGMYVKIVPPFLPEPELLVYASGVAEVAGGAALMARSPRIRRLGGFWTTATLLAVFPANVHMALHPEDFDVPGGRAALYARLPVQVAFVAWALAAGRRRG